MKKTCSVCGKPLPSRLTIASYCQACRAAVAAVQADAARSMGSHPLAPPDVPCVDCGARATCWDHRYYCLPLEVDPVCSACNTNRGPALDVVRLAREKLNLSDAPAAAALTLPQRMEQAERYAIMEALRETKHNATAAARLLGITYRSIRYRMQILKIER